MYCLLFSAPSGKHNADSLCSAVAIHNSLLSSQRGVRHVCWNVIFPTSAYGWMAVTHPQLTSACVCELRFYDNQLITDWPSLSFGSMDAMPLGNSHPSIFEYLYTGVLLVCCYSHFVALLAIFVLFSPCTPTLALSFCIF